MAMLARASPCGQRHCGGTVALLIAGLALAYVDQNVLPARLTGWDVADIRVRVRAARATSPAT
jgi:hypothetical protein